MLDPEFFFDEELALTENSAYVRLFYEGLWCHCDDINHTIPYRPGWLKAQIFPYEDVDVVPLWNELVRTGKVVGFTGEDTHQYGWIKNFNKFQRVEKPSKSKYPAFSDAPPVVVGEFSPTPPAKVKLSKVKEREEETAAAPITFERKILDKAEEWKVLVKELATADYLSALKIHAIAVDEFLPHWLERSEGAKKARWQREKVFDYKLRFRTWIGNHHKYAKDWTCKDGLWHRKGESCYCKPPEEKKTGPLLPDHAIAVRVLAQSKSIT